MSSTVKPTLGRQVVVLVDPETNDGRDEVVGFVSVVNKDETATVTVLTPGQPQGVATGVRLFTSRAEAEDALREHLGDLPARKADQDPPTVLTVTRWVQVAYLLTDVRDDELRTELAALRSEVASLGEVVTAVETPAS